MSYEIGTTAAANSGKTRLQLSLEKAKRKEGPSIGQWLAFPGHALAKTVASLGEDVSSCPFPSIAALSN
jgi:4-hydroxy-2-oxoheptanedioate aldolase